MTSIHDNIKMQHGILIPRLFKFIELEAETKKPLHSFDEFLTDISKIQNAGIIIPKNIVVVDFDSNRTIAEKILNKYPTFAVKTKRGCHLYYKLPKVHNIRSGNNITTAAGIPVDYKTGAKNKNALAVIKQNGIVREIYGCTDKINELPYLLYPLPLSKQNLVNFSDGDGRNTGLFKHLLNVFEQVKGVKEEHIIQICDFINQNVFNEALEEKEIKNILKSVSERRETKTSLSISLNDCFGEDGKINIYLLSDYINHKLDVKIYNKILYYKEKDH